MAEKNVHIFFLAFSLLTVNTKRPNCALFGAGATDLAYVLLILIRRRKMSIFNNEIPSSLGSVQ